VLCVPQLLTLNSGFEYFYLRARGTSSLPRTHARTKRGRRSPPIGAAGARWSCLL
jgi:hypothetical protein